MNESVARFIVSGVVLALAATGAAQTTEPSSQASRERFRIIVNGLYNAQELSFGGVETFRLFLEEGSSRTSYLGGKGVAFEIGGVFSITRFLGAGASFELFDGDHDASFEQALPHPLLFNQPRSLSGERAGLSYQERAIHLDVVLTGSAGPLLFDVFGGPTFFSTSTELIRNITSSSPYPFDEVELQQVALEEVDDSPLGFNVGGAVIYRLARHFGVAFQARFSRATVRIAAGEGPELELDAGGLHAGGGLRIFF